MSGKQDDDQKHMHDKQIAAPNGDLQMILVVDMLNQVCEFSCSTWSTLSMGIAAKP